MKYSTLLFACLALLGTPTVIQATPLSSGELEALMGVKPGEHAVVVPRAASPRTGFFLAESYRPELGVPADALQLYAGIEAFEHFGFGKISTSAATAQSWKDRGYATQLFLHSRYGSYERNPPTERQTDRHGRALCVIATEVQGRQVDLAIGPVTPELRDTMRKKHGPEAVLREVDYYMLPTRERIEFARRFYTENLKTITAGFCFDEPEIWSDAGYSEAFKAEWRDYYGEDWIEPHASVDARYKAEQLKRHLVRRWVETILQDVANRRPDLPRMLATHSLASYAGMGMSTPLHALTSIPALDEVIAEVWNEPFESCYAQYSSFWHQVRDSKKQLWLMADPWGDSPALSLDFYRKSYGANVVSALMFPIAERFQPLIWPNRLYGKIPPEYETIINSVTGVLTEVWRYPGGTVQSGTPGIATFVADSMAWQRSEPAPSDFDGFDGLTLPLIRRGVPVDVLPLERVTEPGFLDQTKVALLSYDFLKPTVAEQNQALTEWTKKGGVLICFGGTDAYNAVRDAWWSRAGFASPLEDLFSRLGLPIIRPDVLAETDFDGLVEPVADGDAFTVPVGPSLGTRQYLHRKNIQHQTEIGQPLPNPTYPLTLYAPPSGAKSLYRLKDSGKPVVWSIRVGHGLVVFAGIAPGYLKNFDAGAGLLLSLVRQTLVDRGERFDAPARFVLRRGPYTAVRTFDTTHQLKGRYVDVFSPKLEVFTDPQIPAHTNMLLVDAGITGREEPLAVSGRLVSWYTNADTTALVVRAPSQTNGMARLFCGGRRLKSAKAWTTEGKPVELHARAEVTSVLLSYLNEADGLVLRVDWEPSATPRT